MPDRVTVTLRDRVGPQDPAEVERIVRSTGAFREDEVAVAVELVEERFARGEASGYHFLFAETGGATVGYACYGPIACTVHSWDLYWIAVEHARRGSGIGRRLLEAAESAISARGGRQVYVETSSRPDYAATRAFYEARGYAVEAVLNDFYAPGDSKVVFVKLL
jgi:ribosomal protein S18 acetylase RimI-like enzyme